MLIKLKVKFNYIIRWIIDRVKVEASGFPPEVQTNDQKLAFAEIYKLYYDIDIDLERVIKNPGLRFIAKIMLNSLW